MIRAALQIGSGGHLSELALSTLADGEASALSAATHAHLGGCEHCQARFADAVLEHVAAAEAMALVPARAVVRPPWRWIVAASFGLLLTRGGMIAQHWADAHRQMSHAKRALPLALRTFTAETSWIVSMSIAFTAVVLVALLARWLRPTLEHSRR